MASAYGALAAPLPALAQQTDVSVTIPAQSLGDALAAFGRQVRVQVSVDAALVAGIRSSGVTGSMSRARALDRLLVGTGLDWRLAGGVLTLHRRPQAVVDAGGQSPVVTDALRVDGDDAPHDAAAARQQRGRDAVFDSDFATGYKDRAEIERYKGVTTFDLLTGMVNVLSGDARNSGALDPSIRGIQGPGRVPVVVDGTEQALTVWRGYNGATNRAYIDPSLISAFRYSGARPIAATSAVPSVVQWSSIRWMRTTCCVRAEPSASICNWREATTLSVPACRCS